MCGCVHADVKDYYSLAAIHSSVFQIQIYLFRL